jgi:hypothetical protein
LALAVDVALNERHRGGRSASGWWVVVDDVRTTNGDKPMPKKSEPQPPASVVDASKTKKALYLEAKTAGIAGRSTMSKKQLVEALQRHYATSSPPAPPKEPAKPAAAQADSAKAVGRRTVRSPDRCGIVYREANGQGEFQVVVSGADGAADLVGRSPAFRAGPGELRRRGAARAAHELLVQRLLVCGWWPADAEEAWPELEFTRIEPAESTGGRALVTVEREGGRARFLVEELDRFGNPTPLMASDEFRVPPLLPVRPSRQAKAALKDLVASMEYDGWRAADHVGDSWYAISLWRRRPSGAELSPPEPDAFPAPAVADGRSSRTIFG